MFLDLDLKEANALALRDDKGQNISFGNLVSTIKESKNLFDDRSLILVLASNEAQVVTFVLSCLEHGWIPLLLNKDLDKELLQSYITTYQPNAIFCSNDFDETIISYASKESWYDNKILRLHGLVHPVYEQLSFLLPTSGSTGSPKLVRHSLNNLTFSAQKVAQFFNLNANDVALGVLPMYYTMGFSVITSHLQAGACVFLTQLALTDRGFWDILKNEGITVLTGVPYTFEVLFKMRFERVKIPSLRIVTQGGGKLSDLLWDALTTYAEKNQLQFIPTYGQTEGTARMSFLSSDEVSNKKGSIGRPIPNATMLLWDEDGNEIIENNKAGELIYRGGNVTLGYAESLEDLKKTDERNGVLPTGDIAVRDEDGYYFIVGRKKRFLKIYGLRISLDEVELLIKNQFKVDCYTQGTDNQLEVFVVNENMLAEVKQWLAEKLNLFHQALEVKYIQEIPRNASGKVIFK